MNTKNRSIGLCLSALVAVAAASNAFAEEVIATVAGEKITLEQVEKAVRPQLIEIDNARYEALSAGLEQIIAGKLLAAEAKARGQSIAELEAAEVTSKLSEPSEDEISQVFEANKAQLGDATLEEVRPRIVEFLAAQQTGQLSQALVASLREKHDTKVMLQAPRIEVAEAGRQSRGGGTDAPITIIAFSDFECPYCRMAEGTVEKVREKYGDKVRYVHRDYPLPFHPLAHGASQAARCAGDQDKYWEFYDGLWKASGLQTEQLKTMATDLGLDADAFNTCLDSGKYKALVDEDLAAGAEVGVNGTPAFFVNGRMLSGAQPLEAFVSIIDAELAKSAN